MEKGERYIRGDKTKRSREEVEEMEKEKIYRRRERTKRSRYTKRKREGNH